MTVSTPASASEGSSGTRIVRTGAASGTPSVQMHGTTISRKFSEVGDREDRRRRRSRSRRRRGRRRAARGRAGRRPAGRPRTSRVVEQRRWLRAADAASIAIVEQAIATAGAGPRRAMASTSAMKEPESRRPRSRSQRVADDGEHREEDDEAERVPVRGARGHPAPSAIAAREQPCADDEGPDGPLRPAYRPVWPIP